MLGPDDSGTAACPITYMAQPGEKPVITGGSGTVLDNASAGIVVEHNIVHHVAAHALLFNFNDLGNIVQNNILALSDDALMNRAGDPGKLDQTGIFYRNFFYYRGDWSGLFRPIDLRRVGIRPRKPSTASE